MDVSAGCNGKGESFLMQIFLLELKRVLKTRTTLILMVIALLLSGLMSYFPISYVRYTYADKSGKNVTITGIKAIEARRKLMVQGKITQEKIDDAVREYREYVKKYGEIYADKVPQSIYNEKILAYIYITNRLNGISSDYEGKNFYKRCRKYLKNYMTEKYTGLPKVQKKALRMYKKVNTPFEFIYGYGSSDAPAYLSLYIFLLVIICAIITAPVFSSEYQSGSDNILRCTKHGRQKLAVTKIVSAVLISGMIFTICISIFAVIENSVFGWDSLKTSFQIASTAVSLPALNVGEAQILTIAVGMLTLISVVSFTMFISAKCKNTTNSLIISIIFCLMPIIISTIASGNISSWVRLILPAGGTGLSYSFSAELCDWRFLRLGSFFAWSPYVIIGVAIIEIPLFLTLTVLSYCKHECA
jgi:ABC-type transport system involved in multi-copper enzyme maturation permease subunit